MIDIHSHLLPGIDDGSRSLGQSVEVLRRMVAEGVSGLVLTPHVTASELNAGAQAAVARRDVRLEQLRPHVPPALQLYPGFEIMLDQPLTPLALGDRRLSLAASRYYLVEFPPSVVGEFAARALRDIARAGVVPVLAHPERYDACTPEEVRAWRTAGARIQVDARTLGRPTTRGVRARRVVAAGLADVIAADNHGDGRSLTSAAALLTERAAPAHLVAEAIALLTHLNPLAITNDWELKAVPAVALPERWLDGVRRFFTE
jgi:protein-tyrosine phosphatase